MAEVGPRDALGGSRPQCDLAFDIWLLSQVTWHLTLIWHDIWILRCIVSWSEKCNGCHETSSRPQCDRATFPKLFVNLMKLRYFCATKNSKKLSYDQCTGSKSKWLTIRLKMASVPLILIQKYQNRPSKYKSTKEKVKKTK